MPTALVLGGYGLIGAACMAALTEAGYDVNGVGRCPKAAARFPQYRWKHLDLTSLRADQWTALLQDTDVVVNATGALQDGARDTLSRIHIDVVRHLASAAAQTQTRVIQISAAGVSPNADTAFFRTKAEGDALLTSSQADHVILRPTLVLGREAYGGSALLRALAALPAVLPRVFEDNHIQTVALADVAHAVALACDPKVPSGTIADITEPNAHSFDTLVLRTRDWLGVPAPAWRPRLPNWTLKLTARVADALGWLGWRAPLRSTSLAVLSKGISGDPLPWHQLTGHTCHPLAETLKHHPATAQDRTAARVYLALPFAIATLSLFWLLSGMIGLFQTPAAMQVLTTTGTSPTFAAMAVIGGGTADILLGCVILFRRHTRKAAIGMIGLSAAYLLGAAWMTPALYADPLGPMVKVLPGMTLAALVALLMDDR
ncbi:MAG: NAD(P)H-binding protein [Rhodobacteraceae bacterium]|nr:NAD(P)H-binding protein [Paracoccaceae bacterium]